MLVQNPRRVLLNISDRFSLLAQRCIDIERKLICFRTADGILYSDVTIATIGDTEYKSLASALEAANELLAQGDVTITLLESDEVTSEMTVGGDNKLTIKLADSDTSGKTISLGTTGYLHLKNAEVLGNGLNDIAMSEVCDLSICVIGREGCCGALISHCDVAVTSIADALDLLLHTHRLRATLRT